MIADASCRRLVTAPVTSSADAETYRRREGLLECAKRLVKLSCGWLGRVAAVEFVVELAGDHEQRRQ
jgi:hypothetical protein